jgi:hypothetical protein
MKKKSAHDGLSRRVVALYIKEPVVAPKRINISPYPGLEEPPYQPSHKVTLLPDPPNYFPSRANQTHLKSNPSPSSSKTKKKKKKKKKKIGGHQHPKKTQHPGATPTTTALAAPAPSPQVIVTPLEPSTCQKAPAGYFCATGINGPDWITQCNPNPGGEYWLFIGVRCERVLLGEWEGAGVLSEEAPLRGFVDGWMDGVGGLSRVDDGGGGDK